MPTMILIEPRSPNLHIFSIFPLPRLGAFILGALVERMGWTAEVMIEELAPIDWEHIRRATLVGISTISSTAPRAYAIADRARALGVPVIMGGPHVTFMPEEALEHADWVVRGEGEEALQAFVRAWEAGSELSGVPNLSFRLGDTVRHNPMSKRPTDMASLPHPDFSLSHASRGIVSKSRALPVQTSRGCPFHCAFCSVTPMFGRRHRTRPVEDVIEELRKYRGRTRNIFFYDDHFTARPAYTRRLLEAMLRENFDFRWSAQVRADVARDPEMVDLMRRSGCHTLYIGFESIDPATLAAVKKQQDIEEVKRSIRIIQKRGIHIHGMFILGFDGDDWNRVRDTVRFTRRCGLTSVQFLILTPLPGSQTFDTLAAAGRILFHDWSLYDAHHVVFRPVGLTLPALQQAQIYAHRRFYSPLRRFKHLASGRLDAFFINWYAGNLNRAWKKKNRIYLKTLELLRPNQIADILVDYREKIRLNLMDRVPDRGWRLVRRLLQ